MKKKRTVDIFIDGEERILEIKRVTYKTIDEAKTILSSLLKNIPTENISELSAEQIGSKMIGMLPQSVEDGVNLTKQIVPIAIDIEPEDLQKIEAVDMEKITDLWFEVNMDFFVTFINSQRRRQNKVITQLTKAMSS